MWNRISGKSGETKNDISSQSTGRNDDDSRSTKRRSGSGSGSGTVVSSNSGKKSSSRGDDRDRGFNPTSTSYSSTSKSPYPGTASASVASSYATAGKNDEEPYMPPGLVRNASLADQMPKSRSSRPSREAEEDLKPKTGRRKKDSRVDDPESRDQGDGKRKTSEKWGKTDTNGAAGWEAGRPRDEFGANGETSRGPAEFPNQIGSPGFSQFPGQYDSGTPNYFSGPPDHASMSSHVQDQFPGQFPTQSTEPYRPPMAASEGGPGLAAEYYGDAGQSVHEQPGFRQHSPSMIVNAEPHLQPASTEHNPPPEPSASGGVGAAASFFSGSFEEDETVSSHGQQQPSTYSTAPSRPDNYHSSSAPAIPTIGGAAMGAAAGYFMGSQTSSHQHPPDDAQSVAGAQSEYASTTYQRPPSEAQDPHYSNGPRPSKPGKPSSHSSNIPIYAAGAAGAAGLAAAAYQQSHHSSSQHGSSMAPYSNYSQHPSTPMMQRHRHRGPFGALVDFFKDPEGVAQFEEYSEITGICKYCFEPGSSPRDAPRRHRYRKRRSNERLGSSTRIDKDSRYYSSENDSRRNKDKTWLATGLAGYGLAKVGETLFKQQNDFDDTYSVKTGRYSPDGGRHKPRRRSRSNDHVETGITSDGKTYKKDSHGDVYGDAGTTTYSTRRRPRSRSRSHDRKSNLTEAGIGAIVGASVAASTSQRRRPSPKGAFVRTSQKSRSRSPERQRKSHKKKKEKGFFSFGGTSSSSSIDLGRSEKRRGSKNSSTKSKDDRKAEAALLGLGAAAAALALNDSRQGHKRKGVKELVGVKETRDKHDQGHRADYKPPKVSSRSSEDEGWESAADDDRESIDLGLAYGAPARHGSRESLSSESSGTSKWGWRWGSKKKHRGSLPKRQSSDPSSIPAMAGAVGAGLAGAAVMSAEQYSRHEVDSTANVPLQHVFPVPTSDPGRFDVGQEGSVASSSRPGVVPIQHPQPITPVSAVLYSSQAPYEHSYSAPTGPTVFSQPPFKPRPTGNDGRNNILQYGIPGGFPQDTHQARDGPIESKLRRRDTSPARFGMDSVANSMTLRGQSMAKDDTSAVRAGNESATNAAMSRRRSTKDDFPGVRFDLTEEQEEEARRERRRKKTEEKQRREAEEGEQAGRDRRAESNKNDDSKNDEKSSDKSWASPAAIGIAGAAIGVAAAVERSKSEETRDQRRERRRREREQEEAEDEEKSQRRQRRRREREREREAEETTSRKLQERSVDIPEPLQDVDLQGPRQDEKSVWQEAARAKTTHENYGDFFTPIELRNRSSDQVKVSSANADADVDLDRSPNIVAITPKGYRDPNALPEFSKADTDDKIEIKFPWQVAPRLRLVEPTPPSTRGSTPVIRPRSASNEDVQDLPSKPSTSSVTWEDDQTHEYTVIAPHDEREEFVESLDENNDRDRADVSSPTEELHTSPDRQHQVQPANAAPLNKEITTYDDDLEFAATLAAGAEDAGFDPSIVIDDPVYRSRDSPPGSNARNMPGGFGDENEPRPEKKERRRKDKTARRQSGDEPNGRDDDAIVQDMVSQAQESEPQDAQAEPVKEFGDDREKRKKSKSKKSRNERKDSGSGSGVYGMAESINEPQDKGSRQIYDSPTESAQEIVSTVASNKESRKNSKRDSTDYNEVASSVSSRSVAENSDDKPKEKKKESIWSRVLGKSTDRLPQENGIKEISTEAGVDDFDKPKRKTKSSKERRSARNDFDDDDARSRTSTSRSQDSTRRSKGAGAAQDSGRIAQDLPTKVFSPPPSGRTSSDDILTNYKDQSDHNELEQVDEQQYESFLGMRPEPPPPPDIPGEEKEPPDLTTEVGVPATPPSLSDGQTRQYADFKSPDPLRSPTALPSPTAVPFHRRRPRPPPGSGRSLSQTPLSSTQVLADVAAQQKPRPRSTEFKSSKEFRPLWLVEKNMPRQEAAMNETYPSLPSSHTTTPASSVHDSEEELDGGRQVYEISEVSHGPVEETSGPSIGTYDGMVSDLLDSQQATPTASTFQDAAIAQDLPSLPSSRASSPTFMAEEHAPNTTSTLRDTALGAVIGGTAAYVLHKATHHDEPLREDLSREEDEQFQQGLDDMAPNPGAPPLYEEPHPVVEPLLREEEKDLQQDFANVATSSTAQLQYGDDSAASERLPRTKGERLEEGLDDVTPVAKQSPESETAYGDDFTPQIARKGKKQKRRSVTAEPIGTPSSTAILDTAPPRKTTKSKSLSAEEVRELQERDAQDAVDSWFEPATSFKKDRKKKKQNKGSADEPQEELTITPPYVEPSQHDVEQSEPKALPEDNTVTQDMPRDRVVDIMTTAALGEDDHQVGVPEIAMKADEAPVENLLLRRQSKSKGKKGKKGRKGTFEEDMTPTPPAASNGVQFADPFSNHFGEDSSQSREAESTDLQGVLKSKGQSSTTSPLFEISPTATPLPFDDDNDLPEEQPRTPVVETGDRETSDEARSTPQSFSEVAPVEKETATHEQITEDSREPPTQHDQYAAADFVGPSTEQKGKPEDKDKTISTSESASREVEDEKLQVPIGQPTVDALEEGAKAVEDTRDGFSTGKGKASDESDIADLDTLAKAKEEAQLPATAAYDEEQPFVGPPLEETNVVEEEWDSFISKTKDTKGKKAKRGLTAESSATTPSDQGLPLLAAVPGAEQHERIRALVDMPAVDVAPDDSQALDDDWSGFGKSKKKGKKGKKSKPSDIADLGQVEKDDGETPLQESIPPEDTQDQTGDLIDEPIVEEPLQKEQSNADDDGAALSTKKKNKKSKKAKQSLVTDLSSTVHVGDVSMPEDPSGKGEDQHKHDISDGAGMETPQQVSGEAGDEWTGSNAKKKGKKGKKAKQSFTDDVSPAAEGGEELAKPVIVPPSNRDEQVQSVFEEPVGDTYQEETGEAVDEWSGFSSSKKGKKGKKPKVKPFDIEPQPIEPEQLKLHDDTTAPIEDSAIMATTTTSQAVAGMLQVDQDETPPDQNPNEISYTDTEAYREPQEPVFQLSLDKHEGSFKPEPKSEIIAEPSETRRYDNIVPQQTNVEAAECLPAHSLATTDTANDIQSILREEDSRPLKTLDQSEIVPNSSSSEQPSAARSVEDERSDLDVSSKNETNEGNGSEILSFDKLGGIVPAETPAISLESDTSINQEPALPATEVVISGKPGGDDEPDQDVPKKKTKSKKGKKNELFSLDVPDKAEPTEASTSIVQVEPPAEQDFQIPDLENVPSYQLNDDEPADLAAPKKAKKGKKGRKSENFSLEEPEDKEKSGLSLPLAETEISVEGGFETRSPSVREVIDVTPSSRGEPTIERAAEEPEPDWSAPKKQRGKKNKKHQVFAYDDDNLGSPAAATPAVEVEPPIVQEAETEDPRPQEGTGLEFTTAKESNSDQRVDEADTGWDAPKKKKAKKGKKDQVFSYGDLDDSGSQAITTPPVEHESSATLEPPTVQADDSLIQKSKKDKKGKKAKKSDNFSLDKPEDMESSEIFTPPVEMKSSVAQEPVIEDADGFPSKASKKDKNKKNKKKALSGPTTSFEDADENEMSPEESLPKNEPSIMEANLLVEPIAADVAEPVEEDVINDKARDLEPMREDEFLPPKSEKSKKGKRKGLSRNLSGFENASENPDNELRSTSDVPATEIEQLEQPLEPAETIEAQVTSDKARELGPLQDDDFTTPKSKKGKNKAKKSKVFSWDDNVAPTSVDEPISEPRSFAEDGLDKSTVLDDAPEKLQEDFVEHHPDSKEEREEFQSFLREDVPIEEAVRGQEQPDVLTRDRRAGEVQRIDPTLPEEQIVADYEGLAPSHANLGSGSVGPTPSVRSVDDSSSNPLLSEQGLIVRDAPARQIEEHEADINPTADEENESEKAKGKGTQAGVSSWKGDDVQEAPAEMTEGLVPEGKDSDALPIVPMPKDTSDWSPQDQLAEVTEPTDVVEPGEKPAELLRHEENEPTFKPSEETVGLDPLLLVDRDDDLAPSKKSKKGKKKRTGAQTTLADQDRIVSIKTAGLEAKQEVIDDDPELPADGRYETASSPAKDSSNRAAEVEMLDEREQREYDRKYSKEFDRQNLEVSQASKTNLRGPEFEDKGHDLQEQRDYREYHAGPEFQMTEMSSSPAKVSSAHAAEVEMLGEEEQREYDRRYSKELERQDLEGPYGSEVDLPGTVVEENLYDSQEQPEYREHYTKAETQRSQTSVQPATDPATPAIEIEMLDPQEQREYDNEYAKELERQLSPFQDDEHAGVSSQSGEVYVPKIPEPSIDTMMQQPIMDQPYEEVHRPLAQAPGLEDILEEPRSRSGSIQESPADREDDFSPFKSTRKPKKSKKGKKQQQPVIWEDETATPPIDEEIEQAADTSTEMQDVPGSSETGAPNRPIDLEEHIGHETIELTPSAERQPSIAHDDAEDYFAIQPSRGAEKDVGIQQADNLERSTSMEQPRAQSPRWEQHPGQVEQIYQDKPRGEATYESIEPSGIDFPETLKSTSTAGEERVDSNYTAAPVDRGNKFKKSERAEPEQVPRFSALSSEEYGRDSRYPNNAADYYEGERSASQDSSLQRSPRKGASQNLSAEEQSRSVSRSNETEGLAAAAAATAAAGLGLGAIAAEGISHTGSRKAGKKSKKSKKSGRLVEFEDEPRAPDRQFEGKEPRIEQHGQDVQPDHQKTTSAWLQSQVMTPQPAPPPTHAEYMANESATQPAHQPSGETTHRDSAIHVTDSPIVPDDVSTHRLVRDSGYPDTESSPTTHIEPQDHDIDSHQDSRDSDNKALEEDIIDDYNQEPRARDSRTFIPPYKTSRDPEDTNDGETEQDIIDEYDEHPRRTEHGRSDLEDALDMSVEPDPIYDVSVSTPKERRRRSRRRSGAGYDSDDSADSGFDNRRRRRLQAKVDEPREPSPVSSTTKDRSSALFGSSPSAREEIADQPDNHQLPSPAGPVREEPTWSFGHEVSPQAKSQYLSESSTFPHASEHLSDPSTYEKLTGGREKLPPSLFGGPVSHDEEILSRSMSPPSSDARGRPRLNTISEDSQERLSLHKKDKRADSDVGSPEAGVKERRIRSPPASRAATGQYISTEDLISSQPWPTVDEEKHSVDLERSRSRGTDHPSSHHSNTPNLAMFPAKYRESDRKTSNASAQSDNSIHAIIRTPDQVRSASGQSFRSSGTPPLRRVDRSASGDLRGASKLSEAKSRAKNIEAEPDINVTIPSSSTYDPVTDKGKNRADMADVYEAYGNARAQSPMSPTRPPSMRKRQSMQLLDLETRLDQLVSENRLLQSQKSTAERTLQDQARDHSQQRHAYEEAMQEHKTFLSQKESELSELKQILEEWQSKVTHLTEVNEDLSSHALNEDQHQRYRELETEHADLRQQHTQLSTGMESIVQHEVATALEEKNIELRQLRNELDNAKQQVRNLQQQLLASRASDDFVERDDDYFDGQCQALCQHVQQWVLRFSKFSDMKACYRASEVRDEKVVDRMENSLLDGTDFDEYLQDRVKRRDVFMSVVVTMIWEFIFTRYLFGMDREQRQKLKNLEKTLQEVGPMPAVNKWRATTLTLLMKRQSFESQRETDTEAVVHEIYDTLATFLPPPSHLVNQIQDSLRKVISAAVDLSIEMRTQRADYQMLPPLVPEYDTNGDLVGKVRFNALTMNERSGTTSSNEALEEQEAVIRMVLFPLVVRTEEDDEQIVVCPAQVLTAQGSKGKKSVRVMSAQGGRSEASFGGSEGGMI